MFDPGSDVSRLTCELFSLVTHQVEYLLKQVRKGRITKEEAAERLLEYDQLEVERAKGRVFKGFKEGKVTFAPTFKVSCSHVGVSIVFSPHSADSFSRVSILWHSTTRVGILLTPQPSVASQPTRTGSYISLVATALTLSPTIAFLHVSIAITAQCMPDSK